MDLEICVKDEVFLYEKFEDGVLKILDILRSWNNFDDTTIPLTITVKKVKNNGPPALELTVNEDIKSADLFGRQ